MPMQITDEMVRAALRNAPKFWRDYHSAEQHMRAALEAALAAMWRPIEEAPKDGTRILIWFVHANAAYSKDPVGEGWEAAHEACWIDHNGGGWTWYGLCGVATKWMPLPSPPKAGGE